MAANEEKQAICIKISLNKRETVVSNKFQIENDRADASIYRQWFANEKQGNSRYCASGHIAQGSGSLLRDFFPSSHPHQQETLGNICSHSLLSGLGRGMLLASGGCKSNTLLIIL